MSHAHAPALTGQAGEFPVFEQRCDRYDSEAHEVWRLLYERRMATLHETGSEVFLSGLDLIGLEPDRVPDLRVVNGALAPMTGWSAVGVGGFLPAAHFFRSLAGRRFPTTLAVRPRAQLDYLPEPDIFQTHRHFVRYEWKSGGKFLHN